jgi:transcriptional regulator with XRE-family HTH domain
LEYDSGVTILLREWRQKRNLSIRGLARRARMGEATVWKIEVGRMSPSVRVLATLARALDIEVRRLFPRGWPVPTKRVRKRSGLGPDHEQRGKRR